RPCRADFSPDGRWVVTHYHGPARPWGDTVPEGDTEVRSVRLWDPATGRAVRTIPVGGKVTGAAVSPDMRRPAATAHPPLARGRLSHPDGRRIFVESLFAGARLWTYPGGEPLGEPLLRSGPDVLDHAAFSPDGRFLLLVWSVEGRAVADGVPAEAVAHVWDCD